MSEKRIARIGLLRTLLQTCVDEWGFEAVRDCLDAGILSKSDPGGGQSQKGGSSRDVGVRLKPPKPTAISIAAKVNLPSIQKQLIQQLAEQYDDKHFLPTSGDIRYFFEAHGEIAPLVKQRIDSFRRVLKLLSTMPEAALRKMIEDDSHSGPSRLGPLSDAIRGVREQHSFDRDAAHPSPQGHQADKPIEGGRESEGSSES